jgi:hypothetical protein
MVIVLHGIMNNKKDEKELIHCLVKLDNLESFILSDEINLSPIKELLGITEDTADNILFRIREQKSYCLSCSRDTEINLSTIKELCKNLSSMQLDNLFIDYDIESLDDLPEDQYLNFYEDLKNDT